MSTYSSYQGSCGCPTPNTVAAPDSVIVQAGSHVVQMPCPVGSVPQSSSNFIPDPLASSSTPGGTGCERFLWPVVLNTFVTKSIDQTGTFRAECASSWGLPGLLLYFPGLGHLEVLGVSGNTVTYKNRTIQQGTEIFQDASFGVGVPKLPTASIVDDGGGGGGDEVPAPEDGSQLTKIYGENNGVYTRIEPIQGQVLMGIGTKWQRVLLGQTRYPVEITSLLGTGNIGASTKAYSLTLPSKPTLPDGKTALGVEVDWLMNVTRAGSETTSCGITLTINGQVMGYCASEHRQTGLAGSTVANLSSTATTLSVNTTHSPANAGTMAVTIYLKAYHY